MAGGRGGRSELAQELGGSALGGSVLGGSARARSSADDAQVVLWGS